MRTGMLSKAVPVKKLRRGNGADTGSSSPAPLHLYWTQACPPGSHSTQELPTCPSTGQANHLTSEPMSGVPRKDRTDRPERNRQAPAPVQGAIAENTEGGSEAFPLDLVYISKLPEDRL